MEQRRGKREWNRTHESSSILLRIQDVPGSILGHEAGFPEWDLTRFSSVPPGKFVGRYLKTGH